MSDNLVLEVLRAMRADMSSLAADVRELKHRLTSIEVGLAGIRRDIAGLYELQALGSVRSDGMEERMRSVERRLELVEEPKT